MGSGGDGAEVGKSRPSLPEVGRGMKMVAEMLGSTHAGYGCTAFIESNLQLFIFSFHFLKH